MNTLFEDNESLNIKGLAKQKGALNKIYNEDCLKFIRKIPDNSIDLILTDPPYGISYKDNIRRSRYWAKTGKTKNQAKLVTKTIRNDSKDELDWNFLFKEFYRVLKPKKTIYIFCRTDVIIRWGAYIEKSKFKYAHDFLWMKGDMGYGNLNLPGVVHEMVIALSKESAEKSRPLKINDVLKKRVPACYLGKVSKKEYYGHPTQKPIALLTMLILLRTDLNDIIFDPFSGVASTSLAALLNYRRFIGCEIDKETFDQGNKRLIDLKHRSIYKNILPFKSRCFNINSGGNLI